MHFCYSSEYLGACNGSFYKSFSSWRLSTPRAQTVNYSPFCTWGCLDHGGQLSGFWAARLADISWHLHVIATNNPKLLNLWLSNSKIVKEGIRGWDGWMASLMRWTWTWASFGRCWGTGRPGVLHAMGLQRIGGDWVTEKQPQWSWMLFS